MEKDNKIEEKALQSVYEASFILLPSLATEQVPAFCESLRDLITKVGGTVISYEDAVLIDLAYPMLKVVGTTRHKVDTGHFGWVKFDVETDGLETIKKFLDTHAEVVRSLIIRTVRENTLLNGKMHLKKEEKTARGSAEEESIEEKPEAVEEEVVKEEEIIS